MAWMHHQRIGIHDIEERLTASPLSPEESADPPEIHFLREYSNYLTPRKGVTGADFWAFAASYLRNTLLNQIILVLALLSLLLGPRTIVFLLHALEDLEERTEGNFFEILQPYMESQYFALALALILGFVAVTFMGLNLVTVDPHLTKRDYWFARQWAIHTFIVVPLLLSSALFTYGFSQFVTQWGILENAKYRAPLMGLFLYCGMWTGACVIRRIVRGRMGASGNGGPMGWLVVTTAAITGAIIGYLFLPFAKILIPAGAVAGETYSKWHIMTFWHASRCPHHVDCGRAAHRADGQADERLAPRMVGPARGLAVDRFVLLAVSLADRSVFPGGAGKTVELGAS